MPPSAEKRNLTAFKDAGPGGFQVSHPTFANYELRCPFPFFEREINTNTDFCFQLSPVGGNTCSAPHQPPALPLTPSQHAVPASSKSSESSAPKNRAP